MILYRFMIRNLYHLVLVVGVVVEKVVNMEMYDIVKTTARGLPGPGHGPYLGLAILVVWSFYY